MAPESGGMGYLLNYGIFNSDPGIWSRARVGARAYASDLRATCSTADLKSVQVRTQSQINLNNEIFSKNL